MQWLRELASAAGAPLIDVHADADHHRSVFTLAGPGPQDAVLAARHLAAAVAERGSIVGHEGAHPRFGVLDVVPFVALTGSPAERSQAVDAARAFGEWWASRFGVPVFCYDEADPEGRDLPQTRYHAFSSRDPDFGPGLPHPRLGATAVGARKPLIACNCTLDIADVTVARTIAHEIRERDGGLPGVRALGFFLAGPRRAQVSMNLVDLDRTSLQTAVERVRELARRNDTTVASLELVGLLPSAELERCSDQFVQWSGIGRAATVEARVGNGPRRWPGEPAAPAG